MIALKYISKFNEGIFSLDASFTKIKLIVFGNI